MEENVERDPGSNYRKSLRGRRSAKESETSPAEGALRVAPVCKEPPAAREQQPRNHRVTVPDLYPPAESRKNHPARSLRHQEDCEYCASSTTGRGNDRECSKGERRCEDTDRRKERRESANQITRASLDYGRWP